jgi:heme-degrading monooxygenase HmoA
MSLLTYAVHYAVPEKEHLMIDAMHGFAKIVRQQPGVLFVDVFKNTNDGTIVSLTAWQSREVFLAWILALIALFRRPHG